MTEYARAYNVMIAGRNHGFTLIPAYEDIYDLYGDTMIGHPSAISHVCDSVSQYDEDSNVTPYFELERDNDDYQFNVIPANYHR